MKNDDKASGFWNAARVMMVFLFLLGAIVGALIEHYTIEPLIGQTIKEALDKCKLENKELFDSLQKCHASIKSASES